MPIKENHDVAAAREAVTIRLAEERARLLGRAATAQDRIHVYRDRVQGMSHWDMLQILGDSWSPPAAPAPSAEGATKQQCLEWLLRNRPTLTAFQRLAEVRKMVGKGLPRDAGEYVDTSHHREEKEARKREGMRAHLAELADRRAKP